MRSLPWWLTRLAVALGFKVVRRPALMPARTHAPLGVENLGRRRVLNSIGLVSKTDPALLSASGNAGSISGAVSQSATGQFVAFESDAVDLVVGDTNGLRDIFVLDRTTNLIDRVSLGNGLVQAIGGNSRNASISSTGRWVTFESDATNLVPGDTNGVSDVFLYDRTLDVIRRVSTDSVGTQSDGGSFNAVVSADGNFVAFSSAATNLVVLDTNAVSDIFVFNRATGAVERVSIDNAGVQGDAASFRPAISSTGQFVAFQSDATNLLGAGVDTNAQTDIFVYDRTADTIERVSIDNAGAEGDDTSGTASISDNGQFVAFQSHATNLLGAGVDTNAFRDIFVYDRTADTIERVSISTGGAEANNHVSEPAISGDGNFVAFRTPATNLVAGDTNTREDVFVHNRAADTTVRVSLTAGGTQIDQNSFAPSINTNGQFVVFDTRAANVVAGDTNQDDDVFIRDRTAATTALVSQRKLNLGTYAVDADDVSTSTNGRFVAFASGDARLVAGDSNGVSDIFVFDNLLGTIERVSVDNLGTQGNANSLRPSISGDGRYVAFESDATNLILGDTNVLTDIFVYDRQNDTIERVSLANGLVQAVGGDSVEASISGDGRFVAYTSRATNLVPGDANGRADVFVHDRNFDTNIIVSRATGPAGAFGDGDSSNPDISANPGVLIVSYQSAATNLVAGDDNGQTDIFVRVVATNVTERVSLANGLVQAAGGDSINPSLSGDGRFVAFESSATNLVTGDTNAAADIFVYDRQIDTIRRASVDALGAQANGGSFAPSISDNGLWVAYDSDATNLVAGDANNSGDVFVYYLNTSRLEKISVSNANVAGNDDSFGVSLSGDGTRVAFVSFASNLITAGYEGSAAAFLVSLAEAPTNIQLSNSAVDELTNTAGGFTVGTLFTTDVDPGDFFTYSILGGADAAKFSIGGFNGDQLILTDGVLDFEIKPQYVVVVRSTDPAGFVIDRQFVITVNDLATDITDIRVASFIGNGTNTVTLTYSINNFSSVNYQIGFYISSDAVFNGGDILLRNFTYSDVADRTVGTKVKNYTVGAGGLELPFPGNTASLPAGEFFILAVADPANLINEGDATPTAEDNEAVFRGGYRGANPTNLYVQGNLNDLVDFQGANVNVTVPGSVSFAVSGVQRVFFQGHTGVDTVNFGNFNESGPRRIDIVENAAATLNVLGNAQNEAATLDRFSGNLFGGTHQAFWTGPFRVNLNGLGGNDSAAMIGSVLTDTFTGSPNAAVMSATDYTNNITGFENVFGLANDSNDVAVLYDSAAADTFSAGPTQTFMQRVGNFTQANNFRVVTGFSTTATDVAVFSDSAGNDLFSVTPAAGTTPSQAFMQGTTFFNTAIGFRRNEAFATGGDDTASLLDSATSNDIFNVSSVQASVVGPGNSFISVANSFESVTTIARGGVDIAVFQGRPQNDTFLVNPASASMVATGQPNVFSATAFGYDRYFAAGGGGSDAASMNDSTVNDAVSLKQGEVAINGASGYVAQAAGFTTVNVFASTGTDTASFLDSAGDDTFTADSLQSILTGPGYTVAASNFDSVTASAINGGFDTANLTDSTGNDSLSGSFNAPLLVGPGYGIQAANFEQVNVVAAKGGIDTATLFNTQFDERITIFATADIQIEGPGGGNPAKNRVIGFENNNIGGSAGGADFVFDKRFVPDVIFVLEVGFAVT